MAESNRKFKTLLLDPKLQLRLIFYFVCLFMVSTVSIYAVIYLFFYRFTQKAINVGLPEGHVFYHFINGLKYDLDIAFLAFSLFNMVLLIGCGILISHKIAGPMYRIKKFLTSDNIKNEKFVLRQGDFFREIEPVMENLKQKIK